MWNLNPEFSKWGGISGKGTARAWALYIFFPQLRFAREYGWTDRRVLDWVGEVRATCLGNRSWNNARISPLSAGWSG